MIDPGLISAIEAVEFDEVNPERWCVHAKALAAELRRYQTAGDVGLTETDKRTIEDLVWLAENGAVYDCRKAVEALDVFRSLRARIAELEEQKEVPNAKERHTDTR